MICRSMCGDAGICRIMCRDAGICRGMGRLSVSMGNWRCMVSQMVTGNRLDIRSVYRSSGGVNERLRRQIWVKWDRTSGVGTRGAR
jgi:hypothetical protein